MSETKRDTSRNEDAAAPVSWVRDVERFIGATTTALKYGDERCSELEDESSKNSTDIEGLKHDVIGIRNDINIVKNAQGVGVDAAEDAAGRFKDKNSSSKWEKYFFRLLASLVTFIVIVLGVIGLIIRNSLADALKELNRTRTTVEEVIPHEFDE